jgi:hypothetical protein
MMLMDVVSLTMTRSDTTQSGCHNYRQKHKADNVDIDMMRFKDVVKRFATASRWCHQMTKVSGALASSYLSLGAPMREGCADN